MSKSLITNAFVLVVDEIRNAAITTVMIMNVKKNSLPWIVFINNSPLLLISEKTFGINHIKSKALFQLNIIAFFALDWDHPSFLSRSLYERPVDLAFPISW